MTTKNNYEIQELVDLLIKAKEAYYNNEPIMTDEEFDEKEEELKKLDPDNSYFILVGIQAKGLKIKHEIQMLSMNKAKTVEDVKTWLNKILDKRVELLVEPKIDGLSCSIVYNNGYIQYIATRGDGKEGQDITHIKDYIDVTKAINIKEKIEVRGELYLPKNTQFQNTENKSLRNLAVGLINRKTDRDDLKYIKFIAYQLYGISCKFEFEKIKILSELNFDVVEVKKVGSIKELQSYYELYLSSLRDQWLYETDGLIIIVNDISLHEKIDSKYTISHHHFYNIALKPPSEGKVTTLVDVEWNITRKGNYIPVGIIEPIQIGGVEIKRVSLHNAKTINDLQLCIGDKILVIRSNDVIPYLKEVTEHVGDYDDSILIKKCKSCGSDLVEQGVNIICTNHENCKAQQLERIIYWVKQSNMEQISDETIRTLFEKNIITKISDLYRLTEDKLIGIEGIGDKKIANILEQIEKSKIMNIKQFVSKLGIDLVGEKSVEKLGIRTIDDFWKFTDSSLKIGQNIINFRNNNTNFINDILSVVTIKEINNNSNRALKGLVCMTGTGPKSRKELIDDIEKMGYTFSPSVTKDVSILICEDPTSGSSKLQKAVKLGIKLMSYEEFFK